MVEGLITAYLPNSEQFFQDIPLYAAGQTKNRFRRWEYKMDWRKIGLFASLASIFGSIGIYYNGDHDLGIFVGLWASALLLLSDRIAQMNE